MGAHGLGLIVEYNFIDFNQNIYSNFESIRGIFKLKSRMKKKRFKSWNYYSFGRTVLLGINYINLYESQQYYIHIYKSKNIKT